MLGIFITLVCRAFSQCCSNCNAIALQGCLICATGSYLYNNLVCINDCPTGFSSVNGTCRDNMSSKTLFDIDFSAFSDITQNNLSPFENYSGMRFSNTFYLTPLPSKDRGFYLSSNSAMHSTIN